MIVMGTWGRFKRDCGGVAVVKKCDSPQGGVTGIRIVCYLVERCDGHGENVRCVKRCDSCKDV